MKPDYNKNIFLWLALFAVLAISAAIYMSMLTFIADDFELLFASFSDPFPMRFWFTDSFYFRPIIILTFHINYLLFHYNSLGYYFTNLIFHCLNAILIFYITKNILSLLKAGLHRNIPFIISLLFFINPPSVSNLFWISGRTDLIAMTCILSVFLLYKKYNDTDKTIYLFFIAVFMIIGFMTKEILAIVPVLLTGIYYHLRKNLSGKHFLPVIIAYAALIAFFIYRWFIFGSMGLEWKNYISLSYFIKLASYSAWYTFVPFNIVDVVNFYFFEKIYFIIFSLVTALPFVLFVIYSIKADIRFKKYITLFITLLLCSGIYLFTFPAMRLYYCIYPFLCWLILYIFIQNKNNLFLKLSIYSYLILTLASSSYHIYKVTETNNYAVKYIDAITKSISQKDVLDLSNVFMSGSQPVFVYGNSTYFFNDTTHKLIIPFTLNVAFTQDLFNSLEYSVLSDSTINIKVKAEKNIIINSAPYDKDSPKFFEKIYIRDSIKLIPQKFSTHRENYLISLNLIIPRSLIENNINVLYLESNKVYTASLKEFINKFKNF